MAEPRLRRARRDDLDLIADIWVDAFSADPWLRYMAPDDAAWPAFGAAWMHMVASRLIECGHLFLARDGGAAVGWIPPDLGFLDGAGADHARGLIVEASGEDRAADCFATMGMVRPHLSGDSHWTLQWIGVRADRRGGGLGEALVGPGLALCDRDELPCLLVSSNPRNVTFYERHGFRVLAEVQSPDGAITLRPMQRDPA